MNTYKELIRNIRASHEEYAADLKARGSALAEIHDLRSPWLCEQLGPQIKAKQLSKIRKATLVNGLLRDAHQNDRPVAWINDAFELKQVFLDRVTTSDASTFSEFPDAGKSIVFEQREPRPPFENRSQFDYASIPRLSRRLLQHLKSPLERAWRSLNVLLEDLNERAWQVAFSTGRILMFRGYHGDCELLPPTMWTNHPPFQLDISAQDLRLRLEGSEPEQPIPGVVNCIGNTPMLDHPAFHSPTSYLGLSLQLNPSVPEPILGDYGPGQDYVFLLSRDLAAEAFMPGRLPPLGEKLDQIRRARRWFREVVRDAVTLGKQASRQDVCEALSKFNVSKEKAAEVYSVQRPAKWGGKGRISGEDRYNFIDISDT